MSSVRIASLKPSPGAPSSLSFGRRQAVKRSRASGCGAITSMRSAISRPGVVAGTTKALMLAVGLAPVPPTGWPVASTVRAKTV
jgi:hypothetical protein